MPDDTRYLATGARERESARLDHVRAGTRKIFRVRYFMEGQLEITARDASDAYRQAIQWSKRNLSELADLEMDPPEEVGSVQ